MPDEFTEESAKVEEESEATSEEHKEKKTGVQKRINELTYRMRKQERETDYWRKKAEESEAPKEEPAPEKPSRYQYDDEDGYIEAMADWSFDQKNREMENKKKTESKKRQDEERFQRISKTIDDLNAKGLQEFEDYDSVVLTNPDIHVTDPMAEAVAEMDNGHLVAYHLGKNPDKSREIADKSPYAQAVAIAKLEAQLTNRQTKNTTNAPDPINPVSGRGAKSTKKPENMTMDEWMDWRYDNLRR